ncbi:hypothetical protein AZF37_07480 [endosymbiont 'TC1' of Trimyema compressum]|uniref:hypothetical protein n=1 Tax=endosymbiont 'TC1' of Trimyema compressum TaxID=243899 RepID=UPI0007F14B8F|nr:hypothetical protein [endosymbiont 'TC1' of Trimyema compressum]AMP21021.1 hypothetical protein AZF37_07480 [endosymbiont 'TC1' of Trimyema compressum]
MDNENTIKKKISEITLRDINALEEEEKILIDISYLGRPYNFGTRKLLHKNKPFKNNYIIDDKYFRSDEQFRQELAILGKKMIGEVTNNLTNEFKNLSFFISIYQNEIEDSIVEQPIVYENDMQKVATYHLELF